jgi:hypothetical protein
MLPHQGLNIGEYLNLPIEAAAGVPAPDNPVALRVYRHREVFFDTPVWEVFFDTPVWAPLSAYGHA